ncbi:MAG: helix-turn-helix domain-containing protein [Gammaproteobacteria bacterium]|nr:helix-turn-helix domain-containing protein [Gammaproteobacteria bacterium]MDH5618945.1 helix-turn-helix domain-containing protein [Gammaproteobacteria bacterium]
MALHTDLDSLRATLTALRRHGVVPGVSTALKAGQEGFARELVRAVTGEVPAYRESGNPELVPELEAHLGEVVDRACALLAGDRLDAFVFVAEHARRRAAQKFPLDAILHAYRCVHRTLSRWVRDAALASADESAQVRRVVAAVTDFTVEYTGAVGTVLTSEYVAHTRALAEAEGDRRTRLLDTLLSGYDESDRVAAELLRGAGYLEQRQSYCVAIARSVNPREMENPARAQRMADALTAVFANSTVRHLVGVRDHHVVAVLSGTRRLSGWTAPQSLVADRVYPLLRQVGPAAVIGLSDDVPSTSHVPRATSEARLAIRFADVAHRVMRYSDIPFRQVLVTHARATVRTALPAWLDAFATIDRKSRGSLSATLRAYADANMNVLRAAESLGIHPNTIYARMRRIREITGLDPLNYHALTEMLLASECADIASVGVQ